MCQWPDVAVTLFGTHVAESILASVHVRAHQQAGHMNASDPIKIVRVDLHRFCSGHVLMLGGPLFEGHW